MDRQDYLNFNLMLSPDKSGKANSYVQAISIIEELLPYQDIIDLQGRSLFGV